MPKFSVCMPTRERHQTLAHSMQTVLQQTYEDFELIVQDNCSSDETREVVEQFDDPRIIYNRSDERISMHANWEQALNLTTGDYVNYIGDDDALMPDCLEKAAGMMEGKKAQLFTWQAHTYYWPNVPDQARRNHLTLDVRPPAMWGEYYSPEKAQIDRSDRHGELAPGLFCLDSKRVLHNWLDHSGVRVYVPTYHSLVSRDIINKVRALTGGTYFFNALPDFGTLIANLFVADEVFYYGAALSMTGHAGGSGGGTHGNLESWTQHLTRFISEAGQTPEELLPKVFEPFLWNPAILAGCFENVKRDLFPNDTRFEMGWENFLRSAATQVNSEPEAVREDCKAWIQKSLASLGADPKSVDFPPVEPWTRQRGTLVDPLGRACFTYLDCDPLGVETIVDAVDVASQFNTITLHGGVIPWPASAAASVASTRGSNLLQRVAGRAPRRFVKAAKIALGRN